MRSRAFSRSFAFVALLVACKAPRTARAQLDPPFDATLVADTTYLVDVAGATDIAFHTGDGRAVVTRKDGAITIRRANGEQTLVTGAFGTVDASSEKGLLGVVADPNVAENGTFYFYVLTGPNEDKHRVLRGVLNTDDTLTIDSANPVIGFSRMNGPGLEGPANHDGGGLFIHRGQLYVGVGDTGANDEPPTNKYASCLNKGNGKILRVNLDGSVPADNPLAAESAVTSCTSVNADWGTAPPDRRIFAWGLRNPWRFWIDPATDLMWIGDVGEREREEITIGRAGDHHGYPFFEGNRDWSTEGGSLRLGKSCDQDFQPPRPCTPPVHDYSHLSGTSVTGGLIPEGCGWSNAFGGKLYDFFADYGVSWVHALEVRPDRSGVVSATAVDVARFPGGPVSLRQGPDQALYIVYYGDGYVARIAPSSMTGPGCDAAGAGGAAGSGGSGGAASGGRAGAGGAPSAGRSGAAAPGSSGGCGCRTAANGAGGALISVVGLGIGLALRVRRRVSGRRAPS